MGDLWNCSVTYFVSCYNVSQWLQHIGRAEDPSFELQYLVQTFTLVRFHIVWTLGHTHPHRDCHKSGLGKCWAAQLSFMKNGGNRGEVDRNSRRGSHALKRVAHVGFKGCFCVSGWPSHYQSPACPLCKGLSSHAGPHPPEPETAETGSGRCRGVMAGGAVLRGLWSCFYSVFLTEAMVDCRAHSLHESSVDCAA